jgi:hypothetical protein
MFTRKDFVIRDQYEKVLCSGTLPTDEFCWTPLLTLNVNDHVQSIKTQEVFRVVEVNYNHYVIEDIKTKEQVKILYTPTDTEYLICCPKEILEIDDLINIFSGVKRLDYVEVLNTFYHIPATKENALKVLDWLYLYTNPFNYKFSSKNLDAYHNISTRLLIIRAAMKEYITKCLEKCS